MRAFTTSLLTVSLAASAALAAPPRQVRLLRNGVVFASSAPDGSRVAYFTGDGAVNIYTVKTGKTQRLYPDEYAPGTLRWAPDGKRVAFASAAGVFVYDLERQRTERRSVGYVTDFTFDRRGRLWTLKTKRYLFRDGKLAAKLPKGWHSFDASGWSQQVAASGRTIAEVVVSCDSVRAGYHAKACARIWIRALGSGKGRLVYQARPPSRGLSGLVLSPARDRLCFHDRQGIGCLDLKTGRRVQVDSGGGWGHSGKAPFSPSGQKLAYLKHTSNRRELVLYDFATRQRKALLGDTTYKDVIFLNESQLLLYENWPRHRRRGPRPQLMSLDLRTGARRVLVRDTTEYTVPFLIPGHPSLFYMGRENDDGGRNLVQVNIRPPR